MGKLGDPMVLLWIGLWLSFLGLLLGAVTWAWHTRERPLIKPPTNSMNHGAPPE